MVSAREAGYAVYGAWRLAHFDASGLQYFDNTVAALWRSFSAAVIALPAFALITLMRLADGPISVRPAKLVAVEAIAYVASWFAYPLAMFYIARMFDRMRNYCRYIVAYNWSIVLQITLLLAITAIAGTGALPASAAALLSLAVTLAILAYQWFIARVALPATGAGAAALVAFDLVLSLGINFWADRILLAGANQSG